MKNLSKFFPLLGIIYLLSGCASPQPVSRLDPITGESYWLQGSEIALLPPQEDLYVEVSFLRSTTTHLIFELGVQNRGTSTVMVSPEQFRLQPLGVDRQPLDIESIAAIDPEEVLLNLDKREARQIAEEINDNTRALVDATLDLAEDVSTIGKPQTPEKQQAEAIERAENRAYYDSRQYNRDLEMMSIQEQRDYWANNAIRRTTLEPGYEIRGLVLFPRYDQASLLEMQFPIEKKVFSVAFYQTLHHTKAP